MDFFKRKKEQTPNVYNITVPAILRQELGFKTKMSNFYLVTDDVMPQEISSYQDILLKENLKGKKDFRGVYCSPGVEMVSDIMSDLNKYCQLTGKMGWVVINGENKIINPAIQTMQRLNPKQR